MSPLLALCISQFKMFLREWGWERVHISDVDKKLKKQNKSSKKFWIWFHASKKIWKNSELLKMNENRRQKLTSNWIRKLCNTIAVLTNESTNINLSLITLHFIQFRTLSITIGQYSEHGLHVLVKMCRFSSSLWGGCLYNNPLYGFDTCEHLRHSWVNHIFTWQSQLLISWGTYLHLVARRSSTGQLIDATGFSDVTLSTKYI